MATSVEKYRHYKWALQNAREWAQKLGKPYNGGGSGVGAVYEVEFGMTLHYQQNDGDQNYHKSTVEFDKAMATVITKHAPALIAEALDVMAEELKVRAKYAVEEVRAMVEDSGISADDFAHFMGGKNAGDR